MNEQSIQNKKAWEYRAYEAWCIRDGLPAEKAAKIKLDPLAHLKKHKQYFKNIAGKSIANLCGSNGRKAVPLALLGANVTVFDISEENKRYAIELAHAAETSIQYVVTDIYDINVEMYNSHFDIVYMEGGILHYFNDLEKLMAIIKVLLKPQGLLILSDFHPLRRCFAPDLSTLSPSQCHYFDESMQDGDVAFKQFLTVDESETVPSTRTRSYTLSDIINALITSGLTFHKFEEHRGWNNENIPWEFTMVATK